MLMNLLSRYCIVLFFLLFHINIYGQEDSLSMLYGSHSYVEIIGLDLDVNIDDFLTISEDGSFEYHIGNMDRSGVWILNNELGILKYCWEILNTLQTPVYRVECSDWRELQNYDERMEY